MPRRRTLLILAALSGLMIFSCSKKASEPTVPQQPGPICDLSADVIPFDQVEVGAYVDAPLVIKNIGAGTLTGTIADTSSVFVVIGTTTYSLAAGESTSVTVRFQPLALGNRSAVLQFGTCTLSVSGIGVAPVILACEVNPTAIDFGTVPVGQALDRTFTLTNQSAAQMTGSLTGASDNFTVPGSSSYSLAPGQSATFIVRFTATSPGLSTCTIQTGQRGCPTVSCSAMAQPTCAVSTTALQFGVIPSGTTASKSFTITNPGPQRLIGVAGTEGTCSGFGIEGDLVSYNLAPGQSVTVTVDFSPYGEGLFNCTILTGNPGCPNVTCSGLATFPCNCSVGTTNASFGDVVVGQQSVRPFTISTGGETAIGGVISVIGSGFLIADTDRPNLTYTALGYTVNAGSLHSYNLIFQPEALGPVSAVVAISQTLCTRIGTPCDTIHCSGNGITLPPPPVCAASTSNIDFGLRHAGQVVDTTLTLTNTGGGTLSGTVAFSEAPAPFALVGSTSYSLAAGQSKVITVRYTAPAVAPGHTVSDVRMVDLGTGCAEVGMLTVQGTSQ